MTLHKLTAGDGYMYLTRQVAANDATERGFKNLGDYYSERGERPGVWMGRGCSSVPLFSTEGFVSEEQMLALFGLGRHPNAAAIERQMRAVGATEKEIRDATFLGNPYRVYSASTDFRQRCAVAYREYNAERGVDWNTPVPPEERARFRTEIATAMFVEEFGRQPADARELAGHVARISRQSTTAVAGYDLTFSPVKSVSALWAVAPREVAAIIEQAHQEAVRDTVAWIEDNAAYTRLGAGGVAQVETRGLIAAAFTHRDSRTGDPDLHTHVAISNKVQTLEGRWLALDGRLIYKNNVPASERYNTRLEALLIDRLGVRFADRGSGDPDKRPVREIVGIDGALTRQWSSRRVSIEAARADLAAEFQREHGRPPTTIEAKLLAQQANLATRSDKHAPRSEAEQRAVWRAEALEVLGGEAALDRFVRTALGTYPGQSATDQTAPQITSAWVTATADQVLRVVSAERATWQQNHVRAEAERRARQAGVRIADLDSAVDSVVAEALSPAHSIALTVPDGIVEPTVLRRSDGTSVYTVAGSTRYTSTAILAAEQAILAAAGQVGGRALDPTAVDLTLLEATANGVELNPGQVQLVRELATSGARVQLALAPAGTGKTTAMRALAEVWRAHGGTVVGLAPSAAAAAVLREEIGSDTDTLAKLVWHISGQPGAAPEWLEAIGPSTLVVIDEAGMAGTPDLAKAVEFVLARGGSVRLVGDDQQLAAVGAGGVLRDIATAHGAVTLSAVMRFTDPKTGAPNHAEGAASLALRDGDSAALAYYLDNGRVHVGDQSTCTDEAYRAWAADRAAGRDSVMFAPTRTLVTELNRRARRDRLANGDEGRRVRLADDTHASIGDTVVTRQNERRLPISATDWVKNGDRWNVAEVRDDGALVVTHLRSQLRVTLPVEYVRQHVTLGYATTIHGAQGVTAETCHVVATGAETRQLLYVGMTRGRYANHVYLPTSGDGDPHEVITRDALLPPTAGDILTRIVERDGAPVSASSAGRDLADPVVLLGVAAARYHHSLGVAAEDVLGVAAMAEIDTSAEAVAPGVTECEAYPGLRAHLALLAVDGHHPAEVLQQAVSTDRGLGDARDVAAVLDWRLEPTGNRSTGAGPLPWLSAVPSALADHPEWGEYLAQREALVTQLTGQIAGVARSWTPTSAPLWARGLLDRDRDLVADLAIWRAARAVPDSDRHPTGPPAEHAAEAQERRRLEQRVAAILGDPHADTERWRPLVEAVDARVATDPYWPVVAERLTIAARAGIDVAGLVRDAGAVGPLPDEQPAAALWWRLAAHLAPAAIIADAHAGAEALRPVWTPVLAQVLGAELAERVLADPAWPGLVAAVTDARLAGWSAEQSLSAAHDLLVGGLPADEPLRGDEVATALAWRIVRLTDPTQVAAPPVGDEPVDVETHPEPSDDSAPPNVASIPHTNWVSDVDDGSALLRFPARSGVARERLVELNRLATDYYRERYADSWASSYVADRLGTDLATDERFHLGYAPDEWFAITTHLRGLGATDDELIAAGLSVRSDLGRVRDRFRDRVMFPITALGEDGSVEVVGFIGRRHPDKTDDDRVGPKYLNTAETDLFTKGDILFGLAEARDVLASGARPVLVEGPMDALAVTLAGEGQYAGVAPLGTAFTDSQADELRQHRENPAGPVIVATDADVAGQRAAYRAFWRLAARGHNPEHLVVATGKDPAELFATEGPAALRGALDEAASLADTVIDARISIEADHLHTAEGRVRALRAATEVIAALPPTEWPRRIEALAERLNFRRDTTLGEMLDASARWDADPKAVANRIGGRPLPEKASAPTTNPAEILADLLPGRTDDPHWPVLVRHLEEAAGSGVNVESKLRLLVTSRPLDAEDPVRDLDLRLVAAVPRLTTTDGERQTRSRDLVRSGASERLTQEARESENRPRRAATPPPKPPVETVRAPGHDPNQEIRPAQPRQTPPTTPTARRPRPGRPSP